MQVKYWTKSAEERLLAGAMVFFVIVAAGVSSPVKRTAD